LKLSGSAVTHAHAHFFKSSTTNFHNFLSQTATQKTNLILASTQVQHQQTLPALQNLSAIAPATLYIEPQQTVPVPQQQPIYNYQKSPFYHEINLATEQLITDATFNAQFHELKQQWLQYYQQNPALAVEHYHMTADNYNHSLVARVAEINGINQ